MEFRDHLSVTDDVARDHDRRFHRAVERGLAFLAERQLPSGQIPTYVGTDLRSERTFESSPFTTALVVLAISDSSAPPARAVIDRALDFLSAEMEPGGVWSFWASDHG